MRHLRLIAFLTMAAHVLLRADCKDCYWKGFPWCGFAIRCGDDHFMTYGMRWGCLLNADKYCCPAGDGDDIVLCEHKDHKGNCIAHSVTSRSPCVTVDNNDWASSVDTLGKCFRLYEHNRCEGRSVAVYPGSVGHDDLSSVGMNDMVTSVGSCWDHDRYRECPTRSKRAAGNRCEFAMDVLTVGFLAWRARDTIGLTGPVNYYQRSGRNGRTESMEAFIYPRHLYTGTGTNGAAQAYARRMGHGNDDAGHLLASRLGGSGTDLRNIFPQSPNINRGVMAQTEAMVAEVVNSYGSARYNVNLEYADEDATRPVQIVVRIARGDTGEVILINDLVNP
ncbi:uncharacterized protein LOC126844884 [Adelges cooleyi]|uniref:uncharacterized protein LOC126844884 n=1 Tax=Adelges cooleyi TaxID=133065 RepID=UPI00217F8F77|nr:uncharacterized protein LOC126844884 [Adelges cooleyi]